MKYIAIISLSFCLTGCAGTKIMVYPEPRSQVYSSPRYSSAVIFPKEVTDISFSTMLAKEMKKTRYVQEAYIADPGQNSLKEFITANSTNDCVFVSVHHRLESDMHPVRNISQAIIAGLFLCIPNTFLWYGADYTFSCEGIAYYKMKSVGVINSSTQGQVSSKILTGPDHDILFGKMFYDCYESLSEQVMDSF